MKERAMKSTITRLSAIVALASTPVLAQTQTTTQKQAAPTAIYPSKGQTPQQQEQDVAECGAWATKQSGVDPAAVANAQQQPAGQGDAVRGAGRGAAAGAIIGGITGNAGTGAAVGAATGGMAGAGRRASKQQKQQSTTESAMSAYNNARTACLTGRGYSVK
jgi:hypothetical protein